MTAPAKTDPLSEIAELYRTKGPKWRARDMIVQLRAVEPDGDGSDAEPDDDEPIPVTLSSENPVERYEWWTDTAYTEILDADQVDLSYARDGLPFCVDHCTGRQVGLVENVRVDPKFKTIIGEVRQGNHPDAQWVFADIRAGIRKKVSIGYLQGDYSVEKQKGGAAEIRHYASLLLEGSSVCIPADYEVGFDGRSQLRALRAGAPPRPELTRTPEEPMPAPGTDDAAVASAEKERAANETLRQEALGVLAESYSEVVDVKTLRAWQSDATMTSDKARGIILAKIGERSKTETGNTRTGGAPDVFVRSPKGAIGRDGEVKDSDRTFGFDNAGEFMRAVASQAQGRGIDPRLANRAAAGQSEGSMADGGFIVPPEFMVEAVDPIYKTGEILSRVKRQPISGNTLNVAMVDETSRANGSRFGAVTAYWADEAASATAAGLVKWRNHLFNTKKVIAKAAITDEQLEDTPALTDVLTTGFREELQFLVEDAIINGNGVGKPMGILNHAALVKVAIEGSQTIANTAASIALNTSKMYARMAPSLLQNAVWLANIDIFPKVIAATLGGTSAAMPVYMPPGGLSGSPYGNILGRPVVFTEYSAAEGTPGDLLLVNLGQYTLAEKSSGIRAASSAHVNFNTDEMVFRFTYRVDGQPRWKSAITPFKGSATKSFAIALDTRS